MPLSPLKDNADESVLFEGVEMFFGKSHFQRSVKCLCKTSRVIISRQKIERLKRRLPRASSWSYQSYRSVFSGMALFSLIVVVVVLHENCDLCEEDAFNNVSALFWRLTSPIVEGDHCAHSIVRRLQCLELKYTQSKVGEIFSGECRF